MTFFVCDGNSGDLYRNQVLLKLAKRKDGSFADFGSDPVHDGQAFKITKSNWIERQADPLPDTKEKFERYEAFVLKKLEKMMKESDSEYFSG